MSNGAGKLDLITSQPVPFSVRVGDGEGLLTNCHFMRPRDEGEIRWQELAGLMKYLLTLTGHALQWLVNGDECLFTCSNFLKGNAFTGAGNRKRVGSNALK